MPTVIDSLIIELGLDPSQFEAGQKKAAAALVKTREEATKTSKEIESEVGDKLANAFQKATTRILAFMAAMAGASSLAAFTRNSVSAGLALNVMAQTLGMAPGRLSALGNAIERAGGNADATASSLKRLNDTRIAFNTEPGAAAPIWAQILGVDIHSAKDGEDFLNKLVEGAKRQNRTLEEFIYESGTMGVDPATARFYYERGRGGVDKEVADNTPDAWTQPQIDAMQRINDAFVKAQQAVTALGRAILEDAQEPLSNLINFFRDLVEANRAAIAAWVGDRIQEFTKAVEGVDWPEVGKQIDQFVRSVTTSSDALENWKHLGEAFLALWAADKIAGVLGGIGLLMGGLRGLSTVATLGAAAAVTNYIDPDDKFGNWMDSHVPGAAWLDDRASRIGLGRSYEEQKKQGVDTSSINKGTDIVSVGIAGGREISQSNPMPVKFSGTTALNDATAPSPPPDAADGGGGGFWSGVKSLFGFAGGAAGASGGGAGGPVTLSKDYGNLKLNGSEAVAGGAADPGLIALARHLQENDPNFSQFNAFHDLYHEHANPGSKHNQGLAFDAGMKNGDYEGARERMRHYLDSVGLVAGKDYWIEPGTTNHLHVQFQSHQAAKKYLDMTGQAPGAPGIPNVLTGSGAAAPAMANHVKTSMNSVGRTSVSIGAVAINTGAGGGADRSGRFSHLSNIARADYGLA